MGNLEWATKFWIGKRKTSHLILAPTINGIPIVASPTYPLLRVTYLSRDTAATEQGMRIATTMLDGGYPTLLLSLSCPEGPPYRTCVLFVRHQTVQVIWSDGSRGHSPIEAEEYLAAMSNQYSWSSDVLCGRPGYLATGQGDTLSLWHIARVETDVVGRQIFTLSPARLANGLPTVDFTPIKHELLRQKIETDWAELQRCLASNLYSSLVTAAKNVAESLTLYALDVDGKRMALSDALKSIEAQLQNKENGLKLPLQPLDYHLLSKIRILHGSTHSDRVIISGRILDPEFCLSVVSDLLQVLRSCGLVQ
ncbi:MAG: hypothetical protein LC114_18505 [Bryobacterales bacterium]|nr:hypothetical protein [Bryobacterales bacterium]